MKMKLLLFLPFICAVLSVESAVTRGRLGGNARFHYARNSSKSRVHKNKDHSVSFASPSPKSWSPQSFRYEDFYLNYTSSHTTSSVARHSLQSATAKQHHRPRGNSLYGFGYSFPVKTAHGMHPRPTGTRTISSSGTARAKGPTKAQEMKRSPLNMAPTPAPTGMSTSDTTVYIISETDFALLLPNNSGELISDAEADGVAFCMSSGCSRAIPDGFITAAAVERAPDGVSWIQVTGCLDPSKAALSLQDDGGQFDVRFPDGAQCTFGGYGSSFIEQIEPSANRFCLRCCANENDQTNCNSHQDRAGCPAAIPGTYDFPDKGISCA